MLVLSRKESQSIEMPQLSVSLRVMQIRPGRVHLGLEAPQTVRIIRGELADACCEIEQPASVPAASQSAIHDSLRRLEKQIAALEELSAGHDAEIASEIAEEASGQVDFIRNQLLHARVTNRPDDRIVEPDWNVTQSATGHSVHESCAGYAVCPAVCVA
ncbi:MAG: carbon storage regulator [Planctomycetota bacterium]